MAGAEQNREQRDQQAEPERHPGRVRLAGENLDRLGHRFNLHRQQRQHADHHHHGGQCAGQAAAVAEREQIGQGAELIGGGEPQYRRQ